MRLFGDVRQNRYRSVYLDVFDAARDITLCINCSEVQAVIVQLRLNRSCYCCTTPVIGHLFGDVRRCWKPGKLMKRTGRRWFFCVWRCYQVIWDVCYDSLVRRRTHIVIIVCIALPSKEIPQQKYWTLVTCSANHQTWSSRDLSLGLETSRDPFLQFFVSVLVLEPQSLGLGLGLETSESWSWSWSWILRVAVSVLVLEPQSLGLGLGTLESRSRSWSWNLRVLALVMVLDPTSRGLGLGLGTSESWSWSWSCIPRVSVSVLVLEPQSLGFGTSESWSWSWSWIPRVSVSVLVLRLWTVTRSKSCIHC